MPLSKYFGGHGEKVMSAMKKEYGEKKGERVFYATANKRNQTGSHNSVSTGPSKKIRRKHGV